MGLKYVEPIKSAVLVLLIVLSIWLTFSLWTFKPNYQPIDEAPQNDISIAEKQKLADVILPYKVVASIDDNMSGTTNTEDIQSLVEFMTTWSFLNLQEADKEVTLEEVNDLVGQPDSVTLFFRTPIPFGAVDNLFRFSDPVTNTETSFSRIVLETEAGSDVVHFIGNEGGRRFTAQVTGTDIERLNDLLEEGTRFEPYAEVERDNALTLHVPGASQSISNLTFLEEEVKPYLFRNALFPDKRDVQRNRLGETKEYYFDTKRQMQLETEMKTLSYIDPSAGSRQVSIPSELLLDSLDFVNQHGGWTNHFVVSSMDPIQNQIRYQMIIRGYPVFSDVEVTSTEITQVWGNGKIFRYTRPYYQLEDPLEGTKSLLQSGTNIVETLRTDQKVDFKEVDEILRGYNLRVLEREREATLYTLEPAWFYEVNGEWYPVKTAGTGGGMGGLE